MVDLFVHGPAEVLGEGRPREMISDVCRAVGGDLKEVGDTIICEVKPIEIILKKDESWIKIRYAEEGLVVWAVPKEIVITRQKRFGEMVYFVIIKLSDPEGTDAVIVSQKEAIDLWIVPPKLLPPMSKAIYLRTGKIIAERFAEKFRRMQP